MTLGWLFDDALPPALFGTLQRGICGHPDIATLYEHSFWFPLDARPRLCVEHAIASLLRLLPTTAEIRGAEWWVPARPSTQGMEWHCDCDRIVYARHKRYVRPQLSSVLYLGDAGGPTLIVDDVARDATARRPRTDLGAVGYLPVPNRYGIFPGDRFHAVASRDDDRLRVTVAINWWTEKPSAPLCILPRYDAEFLAPLAAPVDLAAPAADRAARPASPLVLSPDTLASLAHRQFCPIYVPDRSGRG
jgi:hypothetical protein